MTFLREDESFESFVTQARALLGQDVARDWLIEVWSGADGDLNRALNHLLDSPDEKIKRGNSAVKPSVPSKPARVVQDFEPNFPAPPPKPQIPQTASYLHSQTPFVLPNTASVLGPSQSFPAAVPSNTHMQTSALECLSVLRGSLELILNSPSMLHNSSIMSQLKQQLLHALEIPEATLVLQERARRVDDQNRRVQSMQERLTGLLADPSIARNPALLQSLGDQMNELRRLTAANIQEQEQLRASLNTSTPADILLLAGRPPSGQRTRQPRQDSESSSSTDAEMDETWWERKKQKKQRHAARQAPVVASAPNLTNTQTTNPFRSATQLTLAPQQQPQPQQPQTQTQLFNTRSQF